MTWQRILLLLFLLGYIDISYTSAKRFSLSRSGFGRSSSSIRTSRPSSSSSIHISRVSHPSGGGHRSGGHVPVHPLGGNPSGKYPSGGNAPTSFGHESISSINSKPLNTGHTGGSTLAHPQSNKDVNTPFLHGEGGGATKPKTEINYPTSNIGFNMNAKPPMPYAPSAPIIPIHDSKPLSSPPHAPSFGHPGTYGNQGAGIPIHQPPIGFKPDVYPNNNAPIGFKPNAYPNNNAPIGFKPDVYPNNNAPIGFKPNLYPYNNQQIPPHPNLGTPFMPPMSAPIGGHSMSYPQQPGIPHYTNMQTGHPINNYYVPSGGYMPSGGYTPGSVHYPQQQYLAQPAAQPFIPGQTVLMVPGQQSSGRGFGDMIKEALIFSTINAGVNRIINPSHHHHYESRPSTEGAANSNGTTTYIIYNNQYFNNYSGNGMDKPVNPQNMSFPSNPMYNPTGSDPQQNPAIPNANFGTHYPPFNNPSTSDINNARSSNQLVPTGNLTDMKNDGKLHIQGNDPNKQVNNLTNNAANMYNYYISDNDLYKISEELFAQEENNVNKYIIMNLQARSTSDNITDVAERPLFYVQPGAYNFLTIKHIRMLYDNYERNASKKEIKSFEKRMEENLFLDTILNTNVMHTAMKWLSSRSFIDPDDFERKDVLRHIWFTQFSGTSSGFERVFASEVYGNTDILGIQDWIYFDYEESSKRINYMGYTDKVDLGNKASLVKLHLKMDGIIRPNVTIFVGTTPELEMSLYTICFYARPNNFCPVSLGNTTFNIYTHAFKYYGKDLIDLALPIF